ncbi:hypothetical protein TWF173_007161 [Orbilia oligospora]|nr:hypothetical protein TWF173_007161 [Orbilia oligospora]
MLSGVRNTTMNFRIVCCAGGKARNIYAVPPTSKYCRRSFGMTSTFKYPAKGTPKARQGGNSGESFATKYGFSYKTAGNPVTEEQFCLGRLGPLLFDTNIISPILDGDHLSEWFEAILENTSDIVVQRYSIAEHLSSWRSIQKTCWEVEDILKKRGIQVISGPCSSPSGTELLCEMLVYQRGKAFNKPKTAKSYHGSEGRAADGEFYRLLVD